MTKQEQFLWLVQTSALANAINLASHPDVTAEDRVNISCTGVFGTMADALYASERIPETMSVTDAANDFVTFFFKNERDMEEEAAGRKLECPAWCRRY